MHLRGVIRTAELRESGIGDEIEMVVRVQGVAADQPRLLVLPFSLLLEEPSLEPETVRGRGFEATVEELAPGRWVVTRISVAGRVLRPGPEG
jgi:hypothetical protein